MLVLPAQQLTGMVHGLRQRGAQADSQFHVAQGSVLDHMPEQDVRAVLVTYIHQLSELPGLGESALGVSSGMLTHRLKSAFAHCACMA